MRLLLLDNFDSFTYNLLDYLQQVGAQVRVVRNQAPWSVVEAEPFDAVVLSPGPGVPAAAGCMPELIRRYHARVPMLGVCLGHQALGEFFGAKLVRAARPVHGKVTTMRVQEPLDALFHNLPAQMPVTRYHSLVLQELPPVLQPLAYSPEGELMALRHRTLPLYGVQFHPEALLTTYGLPLLRNWVKYCIIAQERWPSSASPYAHDTAD